MVRAAARRLEGLSVEVMPVAAPVTSPTSPSEIIGRSFRSVMRAIAARSARRAGSGVSQKTMWPAPGPETNCAAGLAADASAAPAAVTTGLSLP